MKAGLLKFLLAACLAGSLAARSQAADTNSIATNLDAAVNGYLQVQMQLHDTQLELEKSREEARQNAADTAARIQALENSLATQRAQELETAQKNQQSMFMMAGALGLTVLAAVLFMVYLQWRAVTRLVETVSRQGAALASAGTIPQLAAPGRAAVEIANERLFSAVDHLEKRILELEQSARAALPKRAPAPAGEAKAGTTPAASPGANGQDSRIESLLATGQSLLNGNEPEQALKLFDEALAINPRHAGALVKRGGALEKLERLNEAIACYDQAIAADDAFTIAYLHKGGLFNRMARYDEALQCYERALHTQERKSAAAKAV
jgi:tetratricopeptide (TPR) repeat protein